VIGVVGIPIFLAVANQTMISVALPAVGGDLGELARLPWLVIGYMLALTVSGPVYGVLGDARGRARMLVSALIVYIAGSVVAALAPTIEVLAAGRLIQGLGGGGLMSLSQALIGEMVTPRERGRAQGWVATIGTTASTAGPVVGGVLVAFFGWRSLFAATIPLALIALVILRRARLSGAGTGGPPFDPVGFLWLAGFTTGLTMAIEAAKVPGGGAVAVAAAAAAAGALAGLVLRQRSSAAPMFPAAMMRIPAIARAFVMVTCHGAALVALTTILPLFQTILRGDSVLQVAWSMLALTAGFGTAGIATGHLITLTGRTALFPTLLLPVAFAGIATLALAGPGLDRGVLMAVYLVTGLTIGSVMAVVHTTVQTAAPPDMRGRASGATTFFRSIGAVAGTALATLVLFALAPGGETAVLAADGLPHPEWAPAFRGAFWTVAGFVALGWIMAATLPARRVT
jgi:MFS family permease